MIIVAAAEDQHRRPARLDELARDVEDKIGSVHPIAELAEAGRVQAPALFVKGFRPSVEHRFKHLAIARAESDRILQNRSAYALWRGLDETETIRRADASAHQMASLDSQMIEQREVIAGVCFPSVGGADRRARLARVSLVHRDHAEVRREFPGRIERALAPELDTGTHPAGCEQEDWISSAVFLVI